MMAAAAPAGEWSSHQVDGGMLIGNTVSNGIPAAAAGGSGAAAACAPSTMAAAARPAVEMIRPGAAPPPDGGHALRCPRCDSANTKFCYYNNYSLSQPRHFCKACKRYWTRGGSLRNVPVGGGCRKNKRIKRPASAAAAAAAATTISASGSSGATSTATADHAFSSFPFIPSDTKTAVGGGAPSCDLGFLLYGLANPSSDGGANIAIFPRSPYELCHQLGAIGQTFPSNTGEDYFLTQTTHPANIEPEGGGAAAAAVVPSPPLFGSVAASQLRSSALKQPPPHHRQCVVATVHNPELQQTYTDFHAPAAACGGDLPSVLGSVKQEPENLGAATSGGRSFWELQTTMIEQTLEMTTAEPSLFWNNMGAAAAAAFFGNGAWPEAAGCGPSVAPLI